MTVFPSFSGDDITMNLFDEKADSSHRKLVQYVPFETPDIINDTDKLDIKRFPWMRIRLDTTVLYAF